MFVSKEFKWMKSEESPFNQNVLLSTWDLTRTDRLPTSPWSETAEAFIPLRLMGSVVFNARFNTTPAEAAAVHLGFILVTLDLTVFFMQPVPI